jgi:sensor c-di-GMP phosphodiesterase-like protein
MGIVAEVRAALYHGDLFLEYLPVVTMDDRRCVGAEALIRWRRGSRIMQPLEFIPQIENTPVSGLVTYWVIDTVAHELATWLRQQVGVHVAINVPPEVFGRGGLEYAAAKSNVLDLASKFVLEITERGVPDKLGIHEINTRPRKGVLVALDDVCESDAGFLLASKVQVDILKIEKSAVEKLTRATLTSREVSTLYALIRTANVAVIAEGVETESQARQLLSFGIRLAQGWLYSRPLRAVEFVSYFSSHSGRLT